MDNQQPSNNIFYQKPKEGYGFIYKYTSPSNKIYIGQTINTLAERAKNTISGNGYKKCTIFWKAIQKYSFANFQVEILEEVPISQLNELEQYYINFFDCIAPKGYNLTKGGEGGRTTEVYVYSAQNGKLLEHYNSISEASLMTGVPITEISIILSNKSKKTRRIAHNITFTKEYHDSINLSDLCRKNYTKVYVYDNNGNFYKEFNTVVEASDYLRIGYTTAERRLLDGLSIYGFYLRKEKFDKIPIISEDKRPKKGKRVCQINPIDYSVIAIYNSLGEAARAVGLASRTSITKAIERNGKAKGYYWKIIEGSTTKCSENPTETARDI